MIGPMAPPLFYQRLAFTPMWYWFHTMPCPMGYYWARRAHPYSHKDCMP